MAIDHSSRLFKRLKRHNVFPHLVAEDLANGVEHTPLDRLKLQQQSVDTPPTAPDLRTGENKPIVQTQVSLASKNELTTKADKTKITKIGSLVFPAELEANGGAMPYILFQIFRSETGTITPQAGKDDRSIAINAGGAEIGNILKGISGDPDNMDVIEAALLGGLLGGFGGAALAGALATDALEISTKLDTVAKRLLNIPRLTEQTKNLLKSFALRRNNNALEGYIALLAPDSVATSYDNSYDEMSVTAVLGGIGFAMQAASGFKGDTLDTNPIIAEAAATLAGKLTGGDELTRLGLFATTGYVRNPQLELIYSSPVLRKFIFDFRLIPRNAKESTTIKNIITTFKRNAAPLVAKEAAGGRYMVPPNQFEIEFFNNGKGEKGEPNSFLFKTKKCVLTSIGVDYAPNGYATFADGAPVETRLSLSFQEVEIMDRDAIDKEGF